MSAAVPASLKDNDDYDDQTGIQEVWPKTDPSNVVDDVEKDPGMPPPSPTAPLSKDQMAFRLENARELEEAWPDNADATSDPVLAADQKFTNHPFDVFASRGLLLDDEAPYDWKGNIREDHPDWVCEKCPETRCRNSHRQQRCRYCAHPRPNPYDRKTIPSAIVSKPGKFPSVSRADHVSLKIKESVNGMNGMADVITLIADFLMVRQTVMGGGKYLDLRTRVYEHPLNAILARHSIVSQAPNESQVDDWMGRQWVYQSPWCYARIEHVHAGPGLPPEIKLETPQNPIDAQPEEYGDAQNNPLYPVGTNYRLYDVVDINSAAGMPSAFAAPTDSMTSPPPYVYISEVQRFANDAITMACRRYRVYSRRDLVWKDDDPQYRIHIPVNAWVSLWDVTIAPYRQLYHAPNQHWGRTLTLSGTGYFEQTSYPFLPRPKQIKK